jgi:hypothetical protein
LPGLSAVLGRRRVGDCQVQHEPTRGDAWRCRHQHLHIRHQLLSADAARELRRAEEGGGGSDTAQVLDQEIQDVVVTTTSESPGLAAVERVQAFFLGDQRTAGALTGRLEAQVVTLVLERVEKQTRAESEQVVLVL